MKRIVVTWGSIGGLEGVAEDGREGNARLRQP